VRTQEPLSGRSSARTAPYPDPGLAGPREAYSGSQQDFPLTTQKAPYWGLCCYRWLVSSGALAG